MPWTSVSIVPSKRTGKKYTALFLDETTGQHKSVHFGGIKKDKRKRSLLESQTTSALVLRTSEGRPYEDFTVHRDTERKERYLQRHKHEDWSVPDTAGSLSRWILWNKTSFENSVKDYCEKFNLKRV